MASLLVTLCQDKDQMLGALVKVIFPIERARALQCGQIVYVNAW